MSRRAPDDSGRDVTQTRALPGSAVTPSVQHALSGYISCFEELRMHTSSTDIVFACTHCATSYVVDAAAAGVTLQCQRCGQATTVPNTALAEAAGNAARISELQHQLKENESQRTEITSYINQLSIQLHRWQLRLKDLNERNQRLEAELATLVVGGRS